MINFTFQASGSVLRFMAGVEIISLVSLLTILQRGLEALETFF